MHAYVGGVQEYGCGMQVRVRGQLTKLALPFHYGSIPGTEFRSSDLVAAETWWQLSHLIGLGLVNFEGGKRMRTTKMASLEPQWRCSGRTQSGSLVQVTSKNGVGVEYQETRRPLGIWLL